MVGFDWNTFYSLLNAEMNKVCTVGRYTFPKSPKYPYLDIALSDISGGHYDLENNEGSQTPMITLDAYCNNYDDAKCLEVSMKAKKVVLSYGFQCITGPMKINNADPAVVRWTARYKRIFGNGDKLGKLN